MHQGRRRRRSVSSRFFHRGFRHVQQQFFPLSSGLKLFLQLRPPEGTASMSPEAVKSGRPAQDDNDISTYTAYVRPGLAAVLARSQSAIAERSFWQRSSSFAKNVEARERQSRRGSKGGR